jgi:two-component system, chemotaxis family, CheB/CheR fusion protein
VRATTVAPPRPTSKKEESRISELESELAETRDYLQSIQEQHEAANEELQASNEEVQSANEELQSINEELETSKEELESANEELTTVNEEMANRNTELNRLNSDLVNIQTSAHLAIVLLGRDLAIRRFSAQAEKQFNLLATDVGRPFSQVRHNLVFEVGRAVPSAPRTASDVQRRGEGDGCRTTAPYQAPDLESFIAEVIASVREREWEVQDKDGRGYSLRVRPYFTLDNKVDGAVLVLVDINDLKRNEQAVAAARDYAEAIIQTARDPLLILNADLRVHTANQAFYSTFKVSPAESEGCLIYELGNRQWDIPKLRQLLEDILPRNCLFNNFEVRHEFESIGQRTMLLNARRLDDTGGQPARILLGIQDVTEVFRYQAAARENVERFRLLFERSPLPKWVIELETLRFLDVNEAAVEHYGYSREEFLRMTVLDVRTPEASKELQIALARPPHRLPERATTQHRKKNGEVIDVEVRAAEITLAGKRLWLASINDITERKQATEALKSLNDQLASELAATQRLQETSTQLIHEGNTEALYQQILDAAMSVMHSDMASIQMLDEGQDGLRMLAWRGFDPAFGQIFELNRRDTKTSCSAAREAGRRVIVSDVERCDFIVGTTALEDHRKTGIRAVQSTPLFSRGGRMLGMISTHWRNPHQPSERHLRLLDILARYCQVGEIRAD